MGRDYELTRRDFFNSVAALAIAEELHGATHLAPGPVVRVESVKGVPTFTLNGTLSSPMPAVECRHRDAAYIRGTEYAYEFKNRETTILRYA
jgi:hypothetical protein